MPVPDRLNQIVGLLAKVEAVYGTPETLSNTLDGCDLYIGDGDPEPPKTFDVVFDGNNGRSAGTLAPQRRLTPNGFFRAGTYQQRFKGLGTAYSASAFLPNELHRWILASGFDGVFSATPTPQWTYTPTPAGTTYAALTTREFRQASQFDQTGVLANWSFEMSSLGAVIFSFDWKGIRTSVTDVATPAITLIAPTVLPPVASAVTLTVNGITSLVCRSVKFRSNRNIDTARVQQNIAGGHAGFVPGGMMPELEIEIERPLRSTYDPEALYASAASHAVSIAWGTTPYNRALLTLPQAQIKSAPTPGNEGGLATVTLTYGAHASTPTANDFLSFLVN